MNANANDKVRHLIVWEVPTSGSNSFVEMYINPESLKVNDKKMITNIRTKGGYIMQYWGEDYTRITFNGSTGDGGIEALNVLKDVYRNEQIALQRILQSQGAAAKRRQSLAQLATSVVMWYSGQGFRGFFETFNYSEDPSGIIKYDASFTVVETIGVRGNNMPWQKKPWSTIDKPVTPNGKGTTTGGAYNSNLKMGELNAPAINETAGLLSDPQYTSVSNNEPSQSELQENLKENNNPITPGRMFANQIIKSTK